MSTRFIYLRNEKKTPIACLAVSYNRDSKSVSYGISTQNPKDTFDRTIAKTIATGRLINKPITIDLSSETKITAHIITRRIIENITATNDVPVRTFQAATQWLINSDQQQNQLTNKPQNLTITKENAYED